MTLLWERFGGGTKKEIKAVLKSPTELSLLWFVGEDDDPKTPAGKYIGKLMRAQKLRIKRAGPPGHEKNGEVIFQVLFDAALQAVTRTKDHVRDSENQDTFGEVTAALLWDLPALVRD
jgi:hypothetical protein